MNDRIERAIDELAAAIAEFEGDEPNARWQELTRQGIAAFVEGQLKGWYTTMSPDPPPELSLEDLRRLNPRRQP